MAGREIILVDSDDDEESPPKQRCNRRNKQALSRKKQTLRKGRAQKKTDNSPIILDDDDDITDAHNNSTFASHERRETLSNMVGIASRIGADALRTEGAKNITASDISSMPGSSRPRRAARRGLANSAIIPDDDDTPAPQNNSPIASHEDIINDTLSCKTIRTDLRSDVGASRTEGADNVTTSDISSMPEPSQPRRAARRGLAKKNSELLVTSNTLPSHHSSVYSQAITEKFKSLFHSVSTGEVESNVEEAGIGTSDKKGADQAASKVAGTDDQSDVAECEMLSGQQALADGDEKTLDLSFKLQSPSPPPQPSVSRRPKQKHLNKKLSKALKALSEAKKSLKTPPSKRSRKRDSDVIIVGEEDIASKKDMIVKVRFLTKVYRIHMKLTEPFHILIHKLGQEIGKAEHLLGLFLHDRSLEVTQTPQSVDLSVADIIECHCIFNEDSSSRSSDMIKLVIQCKTNRSKATVTANKRRPFADVIKNYAELMNQDADCLTFSFDGDDVDPSDTPSKLEMEDDDVIDVLCN